jgi:cell division protein FtsN
MSENQKPENSKKLLWLAAAVSIFILVVVGAAFLIFSPGKSASQGPLDLSGKAEERQENPQDFLADAPTDPSTTQTTSSGDIIIVYGNDQSGAVPAPTQEAKPATTTIYMEPAKTVPAPQTSQASPAPQTTPTTIKPAATAAKLVAPAVKPAAAPVAKVTTTTKAPAAKTAPAPQPVTGDYWIQAGSFSVRDNANALKSTMAGNSLPAVITVKDIDGKSRYIVRVGPYPTRAEATKWLPKVKSVKGAEQSWITQ